MIWEKEKNVCGNTYSENRNYADEKNLRHMLQNTGTLMFHEGEWMYCNIQSVQY